MQGSPGPVTVLEFKTQSHGSGCGCSNRRCRCIISLTENEVRDNIKVENFIKTYRVQNSGKATPGQRSTLDPSVYEALATAERTTVEGMLAWTMKMFYV